MIDTIVKIICAIMCGFTITYTVKNILYKKFKIIDIKTTTMVILISLITLFSYSIQYSSENMLFRILLCTVLIKIISGESIYKSLVTMLTAFVIMAIGDLIFSYIFLFFFTIDEIRGLWYCILLCNIMVNTFTLLFISIPLIKSKLNRFIHGMNDTGKFSTIFLFCLSALVLVYAFYNISINYKISDTYYVNVIIALTYFVIMIVFLKERLEYNNLMNKYDSLFEYFKEVENNIDEISLLNHEYKNQLAVIKAYIERDRKKEAIEYIDDMVDNTVKADNSIVSELKKLPNGGVKGLLYYKIITSATKNVTVVLDIEDTAIKFLKPLSINENKIIFKALGIYIDNALDAAASTENKVVNIEIYRINKEINIVVSNKFIIDGVDISKINQKNYTTKGQNHGKGIYLINKIIKKTDWLKSERKIINDYYVQKLIIIKDFTNC